MNTLISVPVCDFKIVNMKKNLLLIAVLLGGGSLFAQPSANCGSQFLHDVFVKDHPEILQVESLQRAVSSPRMLSTSFTIPVVFHILQAGGTENISDAQILDALTVLNADFQKLNPDTIGIEPVFVPVAGNASIQFSLATIDPSGNCTNGIDRIFTTLTNHASDCSKLNQWDPGKYLNIWVVRSIGFAGVTSYTYSPSMAALPAYQPFDGVMIQSSFVGTIGTASLTTRHYLTHEVGHYLSLLHMGDACNDGDSIADTPVTDGYVFTGSCTPDSSCNPLVHENFQNFMAFSYCMAMFTHGQVAAMHACLSSPLANRDNLSSAANLLATGVTTAPATCKPSAGFLANNYSVCVGDAIQFQDQSYGGTVSSYNWNFTNPSGTLSSSVANPIITFSNPGWYDVSLLAGNSSGSTTMSRLHWVRVFDGSSDFTGVYNYGFESAPDFDSLFSVYNYDQNAALWQQTNSAAYIGSGSAMLNAFGMCGGEYDDLVSASYDLTGLTGSSVSFEYSSATTDTSVYNEKLSLFGSVDCGKTWTLIGTKVGSIMAPGGLVSVPFYPTLPSQWNAFTFTIPGAMAVAGVRFKIRYDNGGAANNVFIDNFATHASLGIGSPSLSARSAVYPNPSMDVCWYENEEMMHAKCTILLYSSLGACLKVIELSAGNEKAAIPTAGLSPGSYFIQVMSNGMTIDRKRFSVVR